MILTAAILSAAVVASAAVADGLDSGFIRIRRVGGLTHWRVGRLGGSVYLARADVTLSGRAPRARKADRRAEVAAVLAAADRADAATADPIPVTLTCDFGMGMRGRTGMATRNLGYRWRVELDVPMRDGERVIYLDRDQFVMTDRRATLTREGAAAVARAIA
jgi:hypothetical protein